MAQLSLSMVIFHAISLPEYALRIDIKEIPESETDDHCYSEAPRSAL
jgi:hypothetical protein